MSAKVYLLQNYYESAIDNNVSDQERKRGQFGQDIFASCPLMDVWSQRCTHTV